MKKVLIMSPRLDCTFKKGVVPAKRGKTPLIRVPWENFATCVKRTYLEREVSVVELNWPLWKFTPDILNHYRPDLTFIPHKTENTFPGMGHNVLYYMQMVFPTMFSVDPWGWGADAQMWPISLSDDDKVDRKTLAKLRKRVIDGASKFDQPNTQKRFFLEEPFVFFPCQIPHDETIRYHSKVSVAQALATTMEFCAKVGVKLVVKGHPVNPGSMAPLQQVILESEYKHNVVWVDEINVHDCLEHCDAVVTVNSGVGMEALLHHKPVFTFGNADYSMCTFQVHSVQDMIQEWETRLHEKIDLYDRFLSKWFKMHYDTDNVKDFAKLPDV